MSITLYLAEIGALKNPEVFREKQNGVCRERQQKILACRQGKAQQQSLAAGLLLEQLLDSYNCSPERICYKENGKPYLTDRPDLFFNLSHSGEYVLCAIGNHEMGVDIQIKQEAQSRKKMRDSVARRFFTTQEASQIQNSDSSLFFRYWTAKESYLKLTGLGMLQELDSFWVDLKEQRIYDSQKVNNENFLHEYFELPEYAVAVCSQSNDFCERIERVSLL